MSECVGATEDFSACFGAAGKNIIPNVRVDLKRFKHIETSAVKNADPKMIIENQRKQVMI